MQHRWDLSAAEAIALQKEMAPRVCLRDTFQTIRKVAGVDVGFPRQGRETRAAVCVFDIDTLECIEQVTATRPTRFPYIPGLLSFRELPAILDAFAKLEHHPDLLLCDGQGIAHPRRFGVACHLGVLLDMPSIGVGKTRLIGEYQPVPAAAGSWQKLTHHNETVGAVVRTRHNVKPVFVSPGHRISLNSSIAWILKTVKGYKLPEPIRAADKLASNR